MITENLSYISGLLTYRKSTLSLFACATGEINLDFHPIDGTTARTGAHSKCLHARKSNSRQTTRLSDKKSANRVQISHNEKLTQCVLS